MGLFESKIDKMKRFQDVNGLIQILEYDDNHMNRQSAAEALGQIGNPIAVDPLIYALRNGMSWTQIAAARALGKILGGEAVELLAEVLKKEAKYSDEYAAQYDIIEVLGEIGDARAVTPLVQALHNRKFYHREKAAIALGRIGDNTAVNGLLAVLKFDNEWSDVIDAVIGAIGEIGDKTVTRSFIKSVVGLAHDDQLKPKIIAEALAKLGDIDASLEVLCDLTDPSNDLFFELLYDSKGQSKSAVRTAAQSIINNMYDQNLFDFSRSIKHTYNDTDFMESTSTSNPDFSFLFCSRCSWIQMFDHTDEAESKKTLSKAKRHGKKYHAIQEESITSTVERPVEIETVDEVGIRNSVIPEVVNSGYSIDWHLWRRLICWIGAIFIGIILLNAYNYDVPYRITGSHDELIDREGGSWGTTRALEKEYDYSEVPWEVRIGKQFPYAFLTSIAGLAFLIGALKK